MAKVFTTGAKFNSGAWLIINVDLVKNDSGEKILPQRVFLNGRYFSIIHGRRLDFYVEEGKLIEYKGVATSDELQISPKINSEKIDILIGLNKEYVSAIRLLNKRVIELETLCKNLNLNQ